MEPTVIEEVQAFLQTCQSFTECRVETKDIHTERVWLTELLAGI